MPNMDDKLRFKQVTTQNYAPTQHHAQQIHQAQQQGQQPLEQVPQRKQTAKDAERIAAQSGFVRSKARRFDTGDVTQGPIPLPADDVDTSGWSEKLLDDAREHLTLESSVFDGVAEEATEEGVAFWDALVACTFKPTEQDVARLQAIDERRAPDAPQGSKLADVAASVSKFFGVGVDATAAGQVMLAAGLVVGGEAKAVRTAEGGLDTVALAHGVRQLLQSGGPAVLQAQEMNEGINKELNMQRTFVFKR